MVVAVLMAVIMEMVGTLDIQPPRHHEDMPLGAEDLNIGAEKLRQYRGCDHFFDRAEHGMAIAQIEHAVERSEKLVELVRTEQNGDLSLAADSSHDIDRDFLAPGVEADQRLVEQQKPRRSDQRLCEQ